MLSALFTTALLGLCAPALVSAAPVSAAAASAAPLSTAPVSAAAVSAAPGAFSFPLPNGFPNPSDQALKQIEQQALGTLPNGPPPPKISQEGITNLQLIAFNEIFEVAFFTDLILNITTNVTGYQIADPTLRSFVLNTLITVQAQEELHALNANGALKAFNVQPIQPCKYVFPVSNFQDAIALAATFTDVVLGTLQDVNQIFAQNGDDSLVRGVSSVIGQEGEQDGYYRVLQNKVPSQLPFLTTSTREFAFSALQAFVVPGSCPNENQIALQIFQPLNVLTQPVAPKDQNLKFSFSLAPVYPNGHTTADGNTSVDNFNAFAKGTGNYDSLSLVYINQQNLPIVEKLQNVKVDKNTVTFEALFPYVENEMNGLTIAAVTVGSGPFKTADDVANKTIFAPGLIEVN